MDNVGDDAVLYGEPVKMYLSPTVCPAFSASSWHSLHSGLRSVATGGALLYGPDPFGATPERVLYAKRESHLLQLAH